MIWMTKITATSKNFVYVQKQFIQLLDSSLKLGHFEIYSHQEFTACHIFIFQYEKFFSPSFICTDEFLSIFNMKIRHFRAQHKKIKNNVLISRSVYSFQPRWWCISFCEQLTAIEIYYTIYHKSLSATNYFKQKTERQYL